MTSPEMQAVSGEARLAEADRARVQKRTLAVVVASQILGGAGLAAGVTVGALLAQEMLGTERPGGPAHRAVHPRLGVAASWWVDSASAGAAG